MRRIFVLIAFLVVSLMITNCDIFEPNQGSPIEKGTFEARAGGDSTVIFRGSAVLEDLQALYKDGYLRFNFEEITAPNRTPHHIMIRVFYRKSLSPGTYKIETSHSVPLGQSLIIAQYYGGGHISYNATEGSLNIAYAKNGEYKGRFTFSATGDLLKTINDRPVHQKVQVTVSGVFDTRSNSEF